MSLTLIPPNLRSIMIIITEPIVEDVVLPQKLVFEKFVDRCSGHMNNQWNGKAG